MATEATIGNRFQQRIDEIRNRPQPAWQLGEGEFALTDEDTRYNVAFEPFGPQRMGIRIRVGIPYADTDTRQQLKADGYTYSSSDQRWFKGFPTLAEAEPVIAALAEAGYLSMGSRSIRPILDQIGLAIPFVSTRVTFIDRETGNVLIGQAHGAMA